MLLAAWDSYSRMRKCSLLLNKMHNGLRHTELKNGDRIDVQLHSVLVLVQGNEIGIAVKLHVYLCV